MSVLALMSTYDAVLHNEAGIIHQYMCDAVAPKCNVHKYPAIPPGLTVNSGFGARSLDSVLGWGGFSEGAVSDGHLGPRGSA